MKALWEAASNLLSDETKLCIYCLERLWQDEDFRREWTRLHEEFTAKWQGRKHELVEQLVHGDFNLCMDCLMEATGCIVDFAKRWRILPERTQHALLIFLVSTLIEPLEEVERFIFCVKAIANWAKPDGSHREEYINLGSALDFVSVTHIPRDPLFQIKLLLFAMDFFDSKNPNRPSSPLRFLPIPLPWEPLSTYKERIQNLLEAEVRRLEMGDEGVRSLLKEYEDRLGYRFRERRNAIPAILALAEEYHDRCHTRASNRNDKKLMRYATQVYLRVVKRKTWGEIVNALIDEGWFQFDKNLTAQEQRGQWEKWCVLVKMTTRTARKMLEI